MQITELFIEELRKTVMQEAQGKIAFNTIPTVAGRPLEVDVQMALPLSYKGLERLQA